MDAGARRGFREEGCAIAAMLNERASSRVFDAIDLLDLRPPEQAVRQLLRLAPPNGGRSEKRDHARDFIPSCCGDNVTL